MAPAGLKKRSLILAGHATSVALEPAFWAVLEALADARRLTMAALVAEVDRGRGPGSLASALRLVALDHAIRSDPTPPE